MAEVLDSDAKPLPQVCCVLMSKPLTKNMMAVLASASLVIRDYKLLSSSVLTIHGKYENELTHIK